MPTYNRRSFVPLAIKYFLRQTYPNKELIIIDDGTDSIKDLLPADKQIRYFRLDKKVTLGTKLNLACEYLKGEIIAHWDDDDWYSKFRLTYQIEELLKGGIDVCGINNLLYYDIRTNIAYNYIYPPDQRLWLSGSTLCYTKNCWAKTCFSEIDIGMDALFVWAQKTDHVKLLMNSDFAVHMIHGANVSPKKTDGAWWHPYPTEKIRSIIGPDWKFYSNGYNKAKSNIPLKISITESEKKKIIKPLRNIYACLVHENQDCVIDLVRNLNYQDPTSIILLYNGGIDSGLLKNHFPFEQYGAVLYPSPNKVSWGYLHNFTIDCMQYAIDNFSFDTITIVDSDQLAIRPDYSNYLSQFLLTQNNVGLLGNSSEPIAPNTNIHPITQAYKEIDLWKPLMQRFSGEKLNYFYWTYWPTTVFTTEFARDLVKFFCQDNQFQEIMRRSKIWASEEVIFPTLTVLLGYKVSVNPSNYDYVKYQTHFNKQHVDNALNRTDIFWIHPVVRKYENNIRKYIREKFNHYEKYYTIAYQSTHLKSNSDTSLFLTKPILSMMKNIEGWLEEDEADLLIAATRKVLESLEPPHNIVEIGSYHGKSTVVLGSVIKSMSQNIKVYAIDPHDGRVGATDQGILILAPSLEALKRNINKAGLAEVVEIINDYSFNVLWKKNISLLFIDGLHDYPNVARDFWHFSRYIRIGGLIAFHDYADFYPGVKVFVNELLASGKYCKINQVSSLIVIKKL